MSVNKWFEKEIKELLEKVAKAQNAAEVEQIFEVGLTPREINDMARRIKIKEMLEEGFSYSEIRQKLDVSPVIISRVSHKVGYGFRRAYAAVGEKKKVKTQIRPRKSVLRYKGAMPIHKFFE